MIWSRRAALNGVQLDEVDPSIVIQSIELADGRDNISAVGIGSGDGQRVTGSRRETLDVTVKFSIKIRKSNMAGRSEALEKVNSWAALADEGAWLTVNYKPGRRIRVVTAHVPGEGDLWDWTKEFSLTFRAYGVPYWQQEDKDIVQVTSTSSVSRTFAVSGNRKTVMEASFKNTSGSTVNTFSLTCGSSIMSFTGLGLANGETLEIDHNDTGKKCVLRIRIKGTGGVYRSVLEKRSGSDDLVVKPGNNIVSMTAGGAGTLVVSCAGRYA